MVPLMGLHLGLCFPLACDVGELLVVSMHMFHVCIVLVVLLMFLLGPPACTPAPALGHGWAAVACLHTWCTACPHCSLGVLVGLPCFTSLPPHFLWHTTVRLHAAGHGLFEKQISGLYLGEVARRILLRCAMCLCNTRNCSAVPCCAVPAACIITILLVPFRIVCAVQRAQRSEVQCLVRTPAS